MKFGGKSLATPQKTQKICKYIKKIYKNDKKIIIIVSAIGNLTDKLIEQSKLYSSKKIEQRELAVLLSTGETMSSSLFAMALNSIGVPAKSFQANQISIHTLGDYNNSIITNIDKKKLEECINNKIVAIVSGFQGINNSGEITTLGRGGSDTTASAIAACFNCNVEIYSDYNGVFSGDPKLLNFKKFNHISLDFMQELGDCGAKVIDPRATKIAKKHNINIISKSSCSPNLSGTIINQLESDAVSIVSNDNLCQINIVFSNPKKMSLITKIVNILSKQHKIYNINLNNKKIVLCINSSEKQDFLLKLSKRLNLLQNKINN